MKNEKKFNSILVALYFMASMLFLSPVYAEPPMGCSPLFGEYDPQKIIKLLKEGESPNARCLSGMTPLHWARSGEIVSILIKAGADPHATDINGTSPLHMVPDAEAVRVFVMHGVNPNVRNWFGQTPLHTTKNNKPDVLKALLKAGADPNAYDGLRQTRLHYMNTPTIIKLLLDHGARTDVMDRYGRAPFLEKSFEEKKIERQGWHNFLGYFCLPSLLMGFSLYLLWHYCARQKLPAHLYAHKLPLWIYPMMPLGIFLNPAPVQLFMLFISFGLIGIFRWLPGSIYFLYIFIFSFISIFYHALCFIRMYVVRPKHVSLKLAAQTYALKNFYYVILMPYYWLWAYVLTEESGEATGDYIAFFTPLILGAMIFACYQAVSFKRRVFALGHESVCNE